MLLYIFICQSGPNMITIVMSVVNEQRVNFRAFFWMFWKGLRDLSGATKSQDWPERCPSCSSHCNIVTPHSLGPCSSLNNRLHYPSHSHPCIPRCFHALVCSNLSNEQSHLGC